MFAITGESVEEIAKSCAYIGKEKCLAGGDIVVLKHTQNPKYLAYALSTSSAQVQKSKGKVKSKVVHSSVPAIKEIRIPVPPMEVQREIVRILDRFTELTAELEKKLTAELTARKKQYFYFCNHLLKLENTPRKYLNEVITLSRGIRVTRNQLNDDGLYNVYQNSMVPLGRYNKYNCPANTTFIICAGAAGEIGYSFEEFWAADDCFYCICPHGVINRYIYYVLKSQQNILYSHVRKASVPRLARTAIEKLLIPIPSIEEQRRIVSILDRFDALCNDLTSGLPAEIEARRKQYEYYRDKLLSFPALQG